MSPNLRVLCSEDDPDSREMICLILAQEGFETVCPDASRNVLAIAKEEMFDAYLLDNWTPGMSGLELCQRIRDFDPYTPIVFYSGAAYEDDKAAALSVGAQIYVTKPSSPDDLVAAIRLAISTSRPNGV